YVKSRNNDQLRNKKDMSSTSHCKPEDEVNNTSSIVPFGLVAWSLFNDTYSFSVNGMNLMKDLIIWMRTAALPTFRKLYGRIEVDLKVGVIIYVTLKNQYNTYSFDGKKKLVLSTTSWLGGKNDFIGIVYLTVGGLCLFLALFFTVVVFVKP
ncbi:hypothetical protein RYX36_018154, partial [Vicia faba]